jgi:integration host factor subunit alpha
MTLTKKDITNSALLNTDIPVGDVTNIINSFIGLIKIHSKNKIVKIAKFGSFQSKETPERVGRNPRTGQEFVIDAFKRLSFRPSFDIKNNIN